MTLAVLAASGVADAPAPWAARVAEARAEGGKAAVKRLMKAWMKTAKKQKVELPSGAKLKCGGCHEDLRDYPLRPNAQSDMVAMWAAVASGSR